MKNEEKLQTINKVVKECMRPYQYHNYTHAVDVYNTTQQLTSLGNINGNNRFLLETAALLHDVIYIVGNNDNEERSADFARIYLPQLDYSSDEIETVSKLILATKMPQQPEDFLEKIICDADLDNLGRPDFFEKGESLRQELELPSEGWYKCQMGFLTGHKYHTPMARELRGKGKEKNIYLLENMIQEVR
ncbi:HD domain-containing protein [Thermoproteota archaeon]